MLASEPAHGDHTTVDVAGQDVDELLLIVRHHDLNLSVSSKVLQR